MQANCPKCQNRIVVDDAKAPDRPFNVKCPKCQTIVRFPGKAAAAPPSAPSPPPAGETDEAPRANVPPGTKIEGRALVALPDKNQAGAIASCLNRIGLQVEISESSEEGARLLDQGLFQAVVTTRAAGASGESLYQKVSRLSPDPRRALMLVLVGDEYKSGDGTQAFATLSDLVVNTRDAGRADALVASAHIERTRLYQTLRDAQLRFAAGKS